MESPGAFVPSVLGCRSWTHGAWQVLGLRSLPFFPGRGLRKPTQVAARGVCDGLHLPVAPGPQQIPDSFIGKKGASTVQ